MTPKQILQASNYRQFPKPQAPWLMYQEWFKVIFLHIPVDTDVLRSLVPRNTVPDLYEDQGWISILVFTVRNAHPRFTLPLPYLSNFHEINLRTYVRSKENGRPGTTFLDINASKSIPSLLGRAYGLPYRPATIYRNLRENQIYSRKTGGCNMDLQYRASESALTKDPLDIWLTERYIAYQELESGIYSYPIQHREWPLRNIEFEGSVVYSFNDLLLSTGEITRAHYAENVQVLIWNRMYNDY